MAQEGSVADVRAMAVEAEDADLALMTGAL
jgi:hypothetical protein